MLQLCAADGFQVCYELLSLNAQSALRDLVAEALEPGASNQEDSHHHSLGSGLSSAGVPGPGSQSPEKTASTLCRIYHVLLHHDALSAAKEVLYGLGISAAGFRAHQ